MFPNIYKYLNMISEEVTLNINTILFRKDINTFMALKYQNSALLVPSADKKHELLMDLLF